MHVKWIYPITFNFGNDMKLKISTLTGTIVIAMLMTVVTSNATAETFDPNVQVAKPANEFKFDKITPYLKFSDTYGDRASTAHGRFAIIQGKKSTPSHIHSAAYHGVVIKGVVTNGFDGDKNPPKMGPGSYWYVPANAVHVTACVSKEPCMTYVHSDDKFDFIPKD
jgi:quercetin dioxygenase-like cupin family protein